MANRTWPIPYRMVKYISLLLTALMSALTAHAYNNAPLETAVFDESIRSLQVRTSDMPEGTVGVPVVVLNSPQSITIEFDRLTEDRDYMRYSLTHCTRDWRPDGLAYIEYLEGFNEGTIEDYELSHATTVHYVHYRLSIPNADIRPTLSGNYVVKIFPEDNPDDIWIQVRFAVSEQTASLGASWSGRTDVDYNREHQQLEIIADVDNAHVRDAFNDLTLVIEQNGRYDNARTITRPMRISAGKLIYEHQPELIFEGGNEYRRFETVSRRYTPMGVESIDYAAPYYRFNLDIDEPRSGQAYLYDRTLSGGYVVRDADNVTPDPAISSIEADYGVVYFALEMPRLPMQTIYIDTDALQRRLSPESAMTYNEATGRYEKALLLKQGAYSYQYLASDHRSGRTSVAHTEGNHYETANRYNLRLYHRIPGERYDRLIGSGSFSTGH